MGLTIRALSAVVLSVCAVARVARADAESHPRVLLRIDPCLATDAAEVRRITSIELDARLVDEGETDTTRVEASCAGSLVLIEATDPIAGKSLSRLVNLAAEMESARPRLLAIAITELVSAVPPARATSSEEARAAALRVAPARSEVAAPVGPPLVADPSVTFGSAPREPAPAPPRREIARSSPGVIPWRLEGLFGARVLPSPGLTSYGFGARLSHRGKSPWGWSVDLVADGGRVSPSLSPSLGTVSIDTLSVGPSLFLEKAWAWLAVEGDAGLRLGAAYLQGDPADPAKTKGASLVSPWGGPFLGVGVRALPVRTFAVDVGGELGAAPSPIHGEVGTSDVSVGGVWLSAHVGAVFFFF